MTKMPITHAFLAPSYNSFFRCEHLSTIPWATQHFQNGLALTHNLWWTALNLTSLIKLGIIGLYSTLCLMHRRLIRVISHALKPFHILHHCHRLLTKLMNLNASRASKILGKIISQQYFHEILLLLRGTLGGHTSWDTSTPYRLWTS